jgi:hypothetical protein
VQDATVWITESILINQDIRRSVPSEKVANAGRGISGQDASGVKINMIAGYISRKARTQADDVYATWGTEVVLDRNPAS